MFRPAVLPEQIALETTHLVSPESSSSIFFYHFLIILFITGTTPFETVKSPHAFSTQRRQQQGYFRLVGLGVRFCGDQVKFE